MRTMRVVPWAVLTAVLLVPFPARGQDTEPLEPAPEPEVPLETPSPLSPDEVSEFEKTLTLEQAISEAYQRIEVAEAGGEDARDAIKRVDTLLGFIRAKDPLNVDADFLFGRMHLLLRRSREAMQYIERYSKSRKGSTDWKAFRMLGDLCLEAKYTAMALDQYRRAAELSPSESAPHAGMARAELRRGRFAVGEEHARKAVELESVKPPAERNALYYSVLADALLGQQKLDEAVEAAAQAAALGRSRAAADPTDPTLLQKLDGYQMLQERVLRSIIRSYPERTQEHVRLAELLRQRADVNHLLQYHAILITLQSSIDRTAPNSPIGLLVQQAQLLVQIGDTAKARTVAEQILAREKDNVEARQLLNDLAGK